MRVALVSSCTNRKKLSAAPELQARNLPEGAAESVAREWVKRLDAAPQRVGAKNLYAGRAFTEVLAANPFLTGGTHILSAGLGLVALDQPAPGYSLTVAGRDPDNILKKISGAERLRSSDWWQALTHALGTIRPLSRLIGESADTLFVLALPSTYVELVQEDLGHLLGEAAARTRIIGLPSLRKSLPESVRGSLISYDERLEAADSGWAGTRSDFPQRAARHFLSAILPASENGSIDEHASRVSDFLSRLSRPTTPMRQRHTDEALKEIIRDMWVESEGRVTNGLRLLRREKKIACEQSRFKRLFWEVAAEKSNSR